WTIMPMRLRLMHGARRAASCRLERVGRPGIAERLYGSEMQGTEPLGWELVQLRERLALGIATCRRPRPMAVLAIDIHPQIGSAPPPQGVVPQLHRELERRIRACLAPSDSVAAVGELRYAALLERSEEGAFAMHAADRIVQTIGSFAALGATPVRVAA